MRRLASLNGSGAPAVPGSPVPLRRTDSCPPLTGLPASGFAPPRRRFSQGRIQGPPAPAELHLYGWRIEYNTKRPHSSLGWLAPAAYAERWEAQLHAGASATRPRCARPPPTPTAPTRTATARASTGCRPASSPTSWPKISKPTPTPSSRFCASTGRGPQSLYTVVEWSPNVHVFRESSLRRVELDDGLTLWGAAHLAPANTNNFLDGFKRMPSQRVDSKPVPGGLHHEYRWAA